MFSTYLTLAFSSGLISFLSPCVFPLIPTFIAYLSGVSLSETSRHRLKIFLNTIAFILGFCLVFALLGVLLNTVLESVAYEVQILLARIGGLIVIFFGLFLMGILKIPFLQKEYRLKISSTKSRLVSSFMFGVGFAIGWTPCVGAVLGSILALSVSSPQSAFILLLTYALGFCLPFLISGIFTAQISKLIARYSGTLKYINLVFGAILIVFGILMFTQTLSRLIYFTF